MWPGALLLDRPMLGRELQVDGSAPSDANDFANANANVGTNLRYFGVLGSTIVASLEEFRGPCLVENSSIWGAVARNTG